MPNTHFRVSYKFWKVFFHRGSSWRNEGGNSLYAHFSWKNAPVHTSTGAGARVRERLSMLYPASLHGEFSLHEEYLQRSVFLFSQYVWELHSEWDLRICTKWGKKVTKRSNLPCFLHRELPFKAPSWSSSFTDLECSAFAESYFYNPLKHWLHRQLIRFWKRASVWEMKQ